MWSIVKSKLNNFNESLSKFVYGTIDIITLKYEMLRVYRSRLEDWITIDDE